MGVWIDEWIDARKDGCVNVYVDGHMSRCMGTWVHEIEQAHVGHGRFLPSSGLLQLLIFSALLKGFQQALLETCILTSPSAAD